MQHDVAQQDEHGRDEAGLDHHGPGDDHHGPGLDLQRRRIAPDEVYDDLTDDRLFAVVISKPDGRRVLFSRYTTRNAAESVAAALMARQVAAKVINAAGLPATPGASIDGPRGRRNARRS